MRYSKKHLEVVTEVAKGYKNAKIKGDESVKQIWDRIRCKDERYFNCKICYSVKDKNDSLSKCSRCIVENICCDSQWNDLMNDKASIKDLNDRGKIILKLLKEKTKSIK